MKVEYSPKAERHLTFWKKRNLRVVGRICMLISDIQRHPYSGKGKPELLKHSLSGFWSRRIDSKHRLVYKYDSKNDQLYIDSCKGHYS